VERHFLDHHFSEAYHQTDRAWVAGGIPGNHLSPGLLTLLRQVVAEERRYPGKLTPMLCRQLSGRHVAVFKWRKKLKAGPSRPHAVPETITLADRPMALLAWLKSHSGGTLESLWKDLLPGDADDELKHLWYHDLHWVLNQGYGLLLSDSTLHLAKQENVQRGGGKPKPVTAARKGAPERESKPTEKEEKEVREANGELPRGTAGLYALSGTTLAGEPKSFAALTTRGLWPLQRRLQDEEEEEEEKKVDLFDSW